MKNNLRQGTISGFLTLILFGVFVLCTLIVLLTGADIYKKITVRDSKTYDSRTAAQYITTKVHQSDKNGMIAADFFDGNSALILKENYDGELYETKLYCHNGYLMELFSAENAELTAEDGEKILEVSSVMFELDNNILKTEIIMPDGKKQNLTLLIRSGRGIYDEK